ncbi:Homocysteine S-methyltransferase 1 [Geranomyces variabilis]|nr:Homocysteine S-methyltransferase 1 [Geranomyces variabilis]
MVVQALPLCPGPYVDGWGISPCLWDNATAAVLLALIVIYGTLWARAVLRRAPHAEPPAVDQRTPLLHNHRQSGSEPQRDVQVDSPPAVSIVPRLFTPAIFALHLAALASDFLLVDSKTENVTAKVLADTGMAFAWLIATTLVFFAGTLNATEWRNRPRDGLPSAVKLFWSAAYLFATIKLPMWRGLDSTADVVLFGIFVARYVLLLSLIIYMVVARVSHDPGHHSDSDIEAAARPVTAATGTARPSQGWRNTWIKLRRLMPFLWPKPLKLQALVIACFVFLALGRVVNVLVPLQYKRVVDALTPGREAENDGSFATSRPYFCWGAILLYTGLRFLQGGVGLLSSLQSLLWVPVGLYTTREVSVRMLEHLHSLSLQFHINRKTGEVLRVMDRGTSSIGSLLQYLAFNILPVFVDIGLAVLVFLVTFDWSIALVTFTTMALYIAATVWITEWRTKFRREMNELDSAARAKAVDSLLNFETVKYYGAERLEVEAYDQAIREYQAADFKSSASLNVLNTAQNVVITLGLMVGLLMCAKRVSDGVLTVGDFVAFLTYLLQLYQPLNWFGTYYRVISQNFIDMEKMLDLFDEGVAVRDAPNAGELLVRKGGGIEFKDVCFSYDPRQPAVKNLTFSVKPGTTVALCGPSGGGKSTVFRLLFRFYDIQSGSILIDGQDIRTVKQASLRAHIGVVPQDTVLFNSTVMYNIRYGKPSATDDEVIAAAKAAQIHERVLAFPDGYNTKVGERGLRLSGGEKQRIAIARTILKSPSLVLLDEATSALDNTTERLIQDSLTALAKSRTTLVIAHRLSTIVDADTILVLKDGAVVEQGTHDELLKAEGTYHSLWMRQLEEGTDEGGAQNGEPSSVVQQSITGRTGALTAQQPHGAH